MRFFAPGENVNLYPIIEQQGKFIEYNLVFVVFIL